MGPPEESTRSPPSGLLPDLRVPLLALAAWAGGLAGYLLPAPGVLAGAVAAGLVLLGRGRRWRAGRRWTATGLLLAFLAVWVGAVARQSQAEQSPLGVLADEGAAVTVVLTVTTDPRAFDGGHGTPGVLARGTVTEVTGRGETHRLRAAVLVLGGPEWAGVRLGSTVRATGLVQPADGEGLAAVLSTRTAPEVLAGPGLWWRAADAVRDSLRDSVAHRPDDQRALVPALVAGDDGGLDPEVAEDFRRTGLTHLLAVSGTNLTLVVGFVLLLARWLGVRGRWLVVVGAAGIAGFVLVARTEPSVLRAAAMGTVGLLALGRDGRRRGTRGLGVAVVGLLLVDPGLALTAGFALSVVATAGILLLAPGWRDALRRWLPGWAADAVAVPTAAQLACTPLVAALSGQVSLVAVVANLLAAPAVAPATVLGLAGALLGLLWGPAGTVAGTLASWCVAWIVLVARVGADLPGAAVGWGTGALALALLTGLCLVVALAGPFLVRRRSTGTACAALLVVVVLVRPPSPGWPPAGWVVAACDVGQGDALVLRAGPGSAVVVDAGPDPAAVDDCLHRLDVTEVPLVVLTHFHADHVDGLPAVLSGRGPTEVDVTSLADPVAGAQTVAEEADEAGAAVRVASYGETRTVGDVTLQVLAPGPGPPRLWAGDDSAPNDASVVLLAEVDGVRVLLPGDLEAGGQAALAQAWPGLAVDVLKVPHHGSRYQDLPFLTGLGAPVALVSVGADNDYGHPASSTVNALEGAGAQVLRTDLDGDLAVVVDDGGLGTVTER
ncbi:ComEC/Rec2 family competence protein [Nocardioides taihuensis]|uniref:ComEC/Rec2 family competence protein n=1 Tax=Nocardioides taihuensis TaxID=1835606 RepID=A0ABW0BM90_9ACTN